MEYPLQQLFSLLGVESVLDVFCSILLEHQVLLHSRGTVSSHMMYTLFHLIAGRKLDDVVSASTSLLVTMYNSCLAVNDAETTKFKAWVCHVHVSCNVYCMHVGGHLYSISILGSYIHCTVGADGHILIMMKCNLT